MRGYNRQHSSGASTSSKPTIFWDEGRKRFIVKTPFSTVFRNNIQAVCGSAVYLGKEEQAWSILDSDLDAAKIVVAGVFGADFDFIDKSSTNGIPLQLDGAAGAALTMFQIAGYDGAKRVYSMLIKQFHPDYNPSPEANAKAAQITVAWRELKQAMGW